LRRSNHQITPANKKIVAQQSGYRACLFKNCARMEYCDKWPARGLEYCAKWLAQGLFFAPDGWRKAWSITPNGWREAYFLCLMAGATLGVSHRMAGMRLILRLMVAQG
jgi:hypothetical protein